MKQKEACCQITVRVEYCQNKQKHSQLHQTLQQEDHDNELNICIQICIFVPCQTSLRSGTALLGVEAL